MAGLRAGLGSGLGRGLDRICGGARGGGGRRLEVVGLGVEVAFEVARAQAGVRQLKVK